MHTSRSAHFSVDFRSYTDKSLRGFRLLVWKHGLLLISVGLPCYCSLGHQQAVGCFAKTELAETETMCGSPLPFWNKHSPYLTAPNQGSGVGLFLVNAL